MDKQRIDALYERIDENRRRDMDEKTYTQAELDEATEAAYEDGFNDGQLGAHDDGYNEGYADGYDEGYSVAESLYSEKENA